MYNKKYIYQQKTMLTSSFHFNYNTNKNVFMSGKE